MRKNTLSKKGLYKGFSYHQEFERGMGVKYQRVLQLVPEDQSILEIGCHTGTLGEAFKKRGNQIWGVEINPEAALKAEPFYEKVHVGDIEDDDLWNEMTRCFDVILFLDVLEHLVDPWRVLTKCKQLLSPNGFILLSLPNAAFYSVRKGLLLGRFDYRPSGILDRTHLRFFTFYSALKLIEDCGYTVNDWEVTLSELPFQYRLPFLRPFYRKCRSFLSVRLPNLFGAVILFKATPVK